MAFADQARDRDLAAKKWCDLKAPAEAGRADNRQSLVWKLDVTRR
jgi:hypothetical protein